jgi:hypothetical protein
MAVHLKKHDAGLIPMTLSNRSIQRNTLIGKALAAMIVLQEGGRLALTEPSDAALVRLVLPEQRDIKDLKISLEEKHQHCSSERPPEELNGEGSRYRRLRTGGNAEE